ncbi:hypothetical protein AMECASPLE_031269 [Ameca splendens]|uniref:Uncharacterized protein n=1 Tax=Ameca splendens TaxID=208324 RepID=A0ABV0YIG9_9TELE
MLMRAARSPFGPTLSLTGFRGFFCFFFFLKMMEQGIEKARQGTGKRSLQFTAHHLREEMGGLGLYFECKRRIWLGLKEGTEECGGKFRKERSMICVCQWLREKYNMNMQQQSFMLAGQAPDNRTSHTLCFLYQLRGMSSYTSRLTISNFNSGKLEGWTQEIMALIRHAGSICSIGLSLRISAHSNLHYTGNGAEREGKTCSKGQRPGTQTRYGCVRDCSLRTWVARFRSTPRILRILKHFHFFLCSAFTVKSRFRLLYGLFLSFPSSTTGLLTGLL